MSKYEVTYTHVIEHFITAVVEATSEDEAIQKAIDGDCITDDADDAPQQGVEIRHEVATLLDEE